MDTLKRALLSLILVGCSALNSFGEEKEDIPIPVSQPAVEVKEEETEKVDVKTFEEHLDLFDEEFIKTGERNERLFRNTEIGNLFSRYDHSGYLGYRKIDDSFYPTEDEEQVIEDYFVDFLKDSLRETRYRVKWMDDLEEDMKGSAKNFFEEVINNGKKEHPLIYGAIDSVNDLFRYGFSIKGEEADGVTYSPTLNEERRLKDREREERTGIEFTAPEFGRKYILDVDFRYRPIGLSTRELFGGLETEIRLSDFKIAGSSFDNAKLRFKADQEAKASITKLIGNGWYYTLFSKFDNFPDTETVGLTFVRETTRSKLGLNTRESFPSRLSISFVYNNEIEEEGMYVNYIGRF